MPLTTLLFRIMTAAIPVIGLGYVFSVPHRLGFALTIEELLGIILGLAVGAVILKHPFGKKSGWLEIIVALVGACAWFYMSANYGNWILTAADRSFDKVFSGVLAISLMLYGVWRTCGVSISVLFLSFILYGLFGQNLPGVLQAFEQKPAKLTLYLFADSNGIPGAVLRVITTVVLVFIVFGKLLEMTGASKFFTDLAMAYLGHKRGGPAKVAVLASAAFGSINGTTVGNIISTGVITIPLMKKNGFSNEQAAAVEAVASNGGQLAPPIMGATAFLIAEFLQVSYAEVVLAAIVPAVLYFVGLYVQIDAIAVARNLKGMDRKDLPKPGEVMRWGWVYIIPLAVLVYCLMGLGYEPALSGIYAMAALLVLAGLKFRKLPSLTAIREFVVGSGENLLPIIMIGGGAGIVIGVLNISGLGFQLANSLALLAETSGLFIMLVVTALVCVVLGMGMPTSAVYIVLSITIAPAIIRVGVEPLAAHMFIFYFGLLSMLTPPVAVASYVAATIAKGEMWLTGVYGLRMAAVGFFLPFLWVYNPALLVSDFSLQMILAVGSAAIGSIILATALATGEDGKPINLPLLALRLAVALLVGTSTIWLGASSLLVIVVCVVGFLLHWFLRPKADAMAAV